MFDRQSICKKWMCEKGKSDCKIESIIKFLRSDKIWTEEFFSAYLDKR